MKKEKERKEREKVKNVPLEVNRMKTTGKKDVRGITKSVWELELEDGKREKEVRWSLVGMTGVQEGKKGRFMDEAMQLVGFKNDEK